MRLATAQRYCDEFGRAALDGFLRDQIGDDEIEPGECHRRLLSLPWSDVFTTNWDTLLERAADGVPMPGYGVVRAREEIPLEGRPRIVKLHGSLPANFPLVVTQEDYDDYPNRSLVFVNTARQSMMETVFLLLGFSGNDPQLPGLVGVGAARPRRIGAEDLPRRMAGARCRGTARARRQERDADRSGAASAAGVLAGAAVDG